MSCLKLIYLNKNICSHEQFISVLRLATETQCNTMEITWKQHTYTCTHTHPKNTYAHAYTLK